MDAGIGFVHAQGGENAVFDVLLPGFARDFGDQLAGGHIAAVAIAKEGAELMLRLKQPHFMHDLGT